MSRLHKPRALKPLSPDTRRAILKYVSELYGPLNDTRPEDQEPKEAEPKAQEAEVAPPVTPEVHPEEQDAELEAPPPPELSPPPAASPAAAVEPGPAPDQTEAPPPLEEEPSLEPMLVPASEQELPVEGPAQGPKAPAQEAEAAAPVTPEVHPEEPDGELEAPPPPELSPPPAASPAAAVEPGPAPDQTEAPPPLEEEPSLEPMLVPASEEEMPVEGPAQGPLVKCAHAVIRAKLDIFLVFSFFLLLSFCSPQHDTIFHLLIFIILRFWGFFAFIIFSFLFFVFISPLYNPV
ncbi:skin secretory protein xP2-like [Eptesicus fuscus]|uniref:skin secretory protein xP2-like n=1 Tax=Eptesicus fuscus TaxID=29078 RepID=UPI002404558D|nr:skin secretory protein xP2-like [Eptesicus fuscus]